MAVDNREFTDAGGRIMEVMKQLFFFGFTLLIFLPFSAFADAGAEITYPYYKKTERWVHTCINADGERADDSVTVNVSS